MMIASLTLGRLPRTFDQSVLDNPKHAPHINPRRLQQRLAHAPPTPLLPRRRITIPQPLSLNNLPYQAEAIAMAPTTRQAHENISGSHLIFQRQHLIPLPNCSNRRAADVVNAVFDYAADFGGFTTHEGAVCEFARGADPTDDGGGGGDLEVGARVDVCHHEGLQHVSTSTSPNNQEKMERCRHDCRDAIATLVIALLSRNDVKSTG